MAFTSPCPILSEHNWVSNVGLCQTRPYSLNRSERRVRYQTSIILASTESSVSDKEVQSTSSIQRYFETFLWRGHSINYKVEGPETDAYPILIVHGFGASINHWRKNIPPLVATGNLRVYAIDLLGFGGSDKPSPKSVRYSLELWQELVCDFINAQNETKPWSLIGNSIGSLVSLMSAKELGPEKIKSCALINCAGGLTSFRYSELNPLQGGLLWLFNTILFNSVTGPALFENFRKRENIANVLKQVYLDTTAITEELLDILYDPSSDEGACDVFLAVLNGEPGPSPEELLPQLTWCPTLLIWGEKDPWTPLDKGVHPGINFSKYHPGIDLQVVPNGGHCVHDELPDIVNEKLVKFFESSIPLLQ